MTARSGRNGVRLGLAALVVLTGLILSGCEEVVPEQPDGGLEGPAIDSQAGVTWRLVRQGGGFESPDGQTAFLTDVVWSGTRFVAVGANGTIVHSRDGVRWTAASHSGTSSNLSGVAWNGTRFVAVGVSAATGDDDRPDRHNRAQHRRRSMECRG